MKVFVVALAVGIQACATSVSPADGGTYGPEKKDKSGVVAYNPHGIGELVTARRKDALKKIYENCGNSNKYEITKEEVRAPRDDEGDSIATMAASELKFLHFKCL